MSGTSDPNVFAHAVAENYVVLTSGRTALVNAIQAHSPDELTDRILYLTAPAR